MTELREVYLIDGVRSPIGKYGGALSSVRPDDLAASIIRSLLARHSRLDAKAVSDVILGCANQAGEDNRNVARMSLLLAGLPVSVPGETVNRLCASGMSAAIRAADALRCGNGDLFVAGGVESMSRAPYVLSKSRQPFGRDATLYDTTLGWRFPNPVFEQLYGIDSMGETAENVAERYRVNRADQDAFAQRSQEKCRAALESGRFAREIVAIEARERRGTRLIEQDEFPRPDSSLEALAALKPAFRSGGTVTAGNSSGINDGACALLLASQNAVDRFRLQPMARLIASAVVGVEPSHMGIGPVGAVKLVLKRAKLTLKQMDVIELNEAFSAQSLACLRELGLRDDDPRVNPNGGAIALGHPLGMSGARLILTAAIELNLRKKRYALCTMCIGVGQGMASIWERV